MCGADIRAGVEHARDDGGRFGPVLERRCRRYDIVAYRHELAGAVGAEREFLARARTIAYGAEHLRAFERQPYRPMRLARGHRGQHDVRPGRSLAAETAADVRRDHADLLDRNAELLGQRLARA